MKRVLAICGPTGSGKSALAIDLAIRLDGEVVNYDSVQIFRELDIGSAKPTPAERTRVPHHLIDHLDPAVVFSAADFGNEAAQVCAEILERGKLPVLVGGTGFYLQALLTGLPALPPRNPELRQRIGGLWSRPAGRRHLFRFLRNVDPATAARLAPTDRHRIERALEVWIESGRPISSFERPGPHTATRFDALLLGVAVPRADLVRRLDRRVEQMYEEGLVEETRRIVSRWGRNVHSLSSIGYKEALAVVDGKMNVKAALEETKRRTRSYAKRQMTWFRSQKDVHWLNGAQNPASLVQEAMDVIESTRI